MKPGSPNKANWRSNKLAQRLVNAPVAVVAAAIEETPWRTHGVNCGTQCSRRHWLTSVAHVADVRTGSMKTTPSSTTHSPRRTAYKSLRKPLHQRQKSGLLLKSPPYSTEAAREAGHMDGPQAADRNEWKNCFSTIKAAYGTPIKGTAPLLSVDGGTLLTETAHVLQRWAEHFQSVINRPFTISDVAIFRLCQVEIYFDLDLPRFLHEIIRAVKQLSSGKAPGSDAIPAEIYKHDGRHLMDHLTALLQEMERQGVPLGFWDVTIIRLYKRKGSHQIYGNHPAKQLSEHMP
nr:unnamed protein product [Spirometra erinaceieuropaei]